MDNGLTQAQAAEVITHVAFYAGWPNAFSALPVAKDVFEKSPLIMPPLALGDRSEARAVVS
jgi:hypothetical protein